MTGDGDCYQAALMYAQSLSSEEHATHRVCHGEPLGQGPIEGVRHGHAWVERSQVVRFPDVDVEQIIVTCIDKSNGKDIEVPAELYYRLGDIDPVEVKRYEVEAATRFAWKFGHYGPW